MLRSITGLLSLLVLALPLSAANQVELDIDNPTVKWRFKTEGPIRGSATIDGDRIYFGSADGFVYALDKNNGSLAWKFQTRGAISGGLGLSDAVVIAVSRDDNIYALDKKTGSLLWSRSMERILPASFGGWEYFTAAPVIDGNQVLVGSGDGHLYAIDLTSGQVNWNFETPRRIRATPALAKGVVYQPSNDGFVYALDARSGAQLWKFETAGAAMESSQYGFDRNSIFDSPGVLDNSLIFGSRDGQVYAIDLNTRQESWRFGYDTTWAMASSIADDTVYVGWSTNNLISALDARTGKEKWQYRCGAHVYATPLPSANSVYVGSADGNLYRLNKTTGEKIWAYPVGGEIFSSPLQDADTLYFGSDNGYLYALHEGPNAFKAVYHPATLPDKLGFALVDEKITPYLQNRGFDRLDSEAALRQFLEARIKDRQPSVVALAFDNIPDALIGQDPSNGVLWAYLNTGGRILSFGTILNLHSFDEAGNYRRDPTIAERLLDVTFDVATESGNYYSQATQQGRNWGLPQWLTTTNATVAAEGVTPLAFDEYNRVSAWIKDFNDRPGSGFVSCRTWSYNVPMTDADLELILQLATHQLD